MHVSPAIHDRDSNSAPKHTRTYVLKHNSPLLSTTPYTPPPYTPHPTPNPSIPPPLNPPPLPPQPPHKLPITSAHPPTPDNRHRPPGILQQPPPHPLLLPLPPLDDSMQHPARKRDKVFHLLLHLLIGVGERESVGGEDVVVFAHHCGGDVLRGGTQGAGARLACGGGFGGGFGGAFGGGFGGAFGGAFGGIGGIGGGRRVGEDGNCGYGFARAGHGW
ncbi:hypothetical protein EDC01DRAFT_726380 [Geopyxis carbonaria]|nr:hypothetical protein EDC01DRAFT_726380 [Geopyxis carbonaria]